MPGGPQEVLGAWPGGQHYFRPHSIGQVLVTWTRPNAEEDGRESSTSCAVRQGAMWADGHGLTSQGPESLVTTRFQRFWIVNEAPPRSAASGRRWVGGHAHGLHLRKLFTFSEKKAAVHLRTPIGH